MIQALVKEQESTIVGGVDVVGGQDNWLRIYHTACRERYDFLHMDLQSNPVKCYRNFTTLISEGERILGAAGSPVADIDQDLI